MKLTVKNQIVAFLTDSYQIDQYALYLIIVAGICAGAVTSNSSNLWISVNFILPPLLVASIFLFFQADDKKPYCENQYVIMHLRLKEQTYGSN